MPSQANKQKKSDGQLSGMAGEFLTLGQLFKRGYQASVTFGTAKAIDLFVYNGAIDRTFNVQVKTLRAKNCFPAKKENIRADHVYVFVLLNAVGQAEEYFIVPGREILADIQRFFGSSYKANGSVTSVPAINYGPLVAFKDNWKLFEEPAAAAPTLL